MTIEEQVWGWEVGRIFNQLRRQVEVSSRGQVDEQVWGQIFNQLDRRINIQIWGRGGHFIWGSIRESVDGEINHDYRSDR